MTGIFFDGHGLAFIPAWSQSSTLFSFLDSFARDWAFGISIPLYIAKALHAMDG